MLGHDVSNTAALPPPLDQAAVERFWEAASFAPADAGQSQLAAAIAGASPFLRQLMLHNGAFAMQAFTESPGSILDQLLADVFETASIADQPAFMRALRQAKGRAALLIAIADVGRVWGIDEVTQALTGFADACLSATVNWLLRDAARTGKALIAGDSDSSHGCGYVVIAMGKHGAFELNYSSDIDLIVLYDSEQNCLASGVEPSVFFVRMTKRLVGLLQDVTEDGYVFRVDLRLRPDPRATQVAISVEAAANYYESMGQNWERAAMIKARVVPVIKPLVLNSSTG